MRPRTSIFLAASIDGFIADEDGGVDFLSPFQALASDSGDDYGWADFWVTVDTLLLGRATWDQVQTFPEWPYEDRTVLVRTHRPLDGAAHGEQPVAGDIEDILTRLFDQGARHVYIDGGQTARDALREGVVDQVVLTTVPVVLGRGIPLFDETVPPGQWTLQETRACAGGVFQVTWGPGVG